MNNLSIYQPTNWSEADMMADALAKSTIVPVTYQNSHPNCLIALEMALRTGFGVLQVMQSMYVVHGKPSWSAQFIIACINSSGRFSELDYRMAPLDNEGSCTAFATRTSTGKVVEGDTVSIAMAKAEGWYAKKGSKWQTMPGMMLRYRAATFFGRLHCPDIIMGMYDRDEFGDVVARPVPPQTQDLDAYMKGAASIHELMRNPETTYDQLDGYRAQLDTMRKDCGVERDDIEAGIVAAIEAERASEEAGT